MPLIDYKRWLIYFSVHPRWDPWWAMARICTLVVGKFKGREARISDFYPTPKRPERTRASSPERVEAGLDRMFGGVDGEA